MAVEGFRKDFEIKPFFSFLSLYFSLPSTSRALIKKFLSFAGIEKKYKEKINWLFEVHARRERSFVAK